MLYDPSARRQRRRILLNSLSTGLAVKLVCNISFSMHSAPRPVASRSECPLIISDNGGIRTAALGLPTRIAAIGLSGAGCCTAAKVSRTYLPPLRTGQDKCHSRAPDRMILVTTVTKLP